MDSTSTPRPTVRRIKEAVSAVCGVTVSDLEGRSFKRKFSRPRMIGMYLSRQLAGRSFPDIGNRFGGRDHTTAVHACNKIPELIGRDQALAERVQRIVTVILGSRDDVA